MKIYACGAQPDHYTGWGGVGSPIYSNVYTASGRFNHNLSDIDMWVSTPSGEPNGWGYGCLWMSFTNPSDHTPISLTDFWVATAGFYSANTTQALSSTGNLASMVLHTADGKYLMWKSGCPSANTGCLVLSPSLSDTDAYIDLGIRLSASGVSILNIHVSGCGTANGIIEVYTNTAKVGSWSGDLTEYSSFSAVSLHRDTDTSATYLSVAYLFVTDVSTYGHDFNYETVSGTQGTRTDWVGNTASFSAYPVDYTSTNGLYAVAQSDTCTFKPTKTYSLPTTVGAQLGTVLLQGSLVSDITDAAVAPYVLDGATSGAGTSVTLSTTGKNYSFNLTTNPATGTAWTMADINAVELGFVRTDSDVKPSTYALDITETTTNYDVASAAKSAGWDGTSPVDITVTVASGVVVGSTVYTSPAMTFASTLSGSTVSLINNGYIVGAGGIPANDRINTVDPDTARGGPALSVATALSITNNGVIGGGGGAGRPGIDFHASPKVIYSGGYGAGYVTGGDATTTHGGTSSPRADGTTFAGGAAGQWGTSDPHQEWPDFNKASPGGGGGLGAPGGAAVGLDMNGTSYSIMTTNNVAGAAVIGSGTITWVTKGSVYGTIPSS